MPAFGHADALALQLFRLVDTAIRSPIDRAKTKLLRGKDRHRDLGNHSPLAIARRTAIACLGKHHRGHIGEESSMFILGIE
ncbi:hypothetical protein BEK68_23985 [Ralstonia pickettii]|nr:hypothetical protein BEK68_23985 [Ralstonia pickettii]